MKRKLMNLAVFGGAGTILLGLLAAGPAQAGTSTGSMQVSANVAGACTITASPMSFGVLSLSGGETTQQTTSTTVSYSCNTTPTSFTVANGTNDTSATGSGYNYAMANGDNYISYGLDVYDNSATFTLANAAVPGTPSSMYNTVDGAASPTLGTTGGPYTVSAQIPASQATVAGTYDDTVTFTMAF
jgi:spore coat protein U-like protein